MWTEAFKRWMNLMMWWLPQQQQPEERQKEAAPEQRKAEPPAPESKPAAESKPSAEAQAPPSAPESAPQPEPPRATDVPPEPQEPKQAEPATAAQTAAPDEDLTEIKGIGPAMQQKLSDLGITRFEQLAEADVEALTEKLKASQRTITKERVEGWIEAARKHRS